MAKEIHKCWRPPWRPWWCCTWGKSKEIHRGVGWELDHGYYNWMSIMSMYTCILYIYNTGVWLKTIDVDFPQCWCWLLVWCFLVLVMLVLVLLLPSFSSSFFFLVSLIGRFTMQTLLMYVFLSVVLIFILIILGITKCIRMSLWIDWMCLSTSLLKRNQPRKNNRYEIEQPLYEGMMCYHDKVWLSAYIKISH